MKKRILSFVLSAVMAFIGIPFTADITVFAGVDDYPAKYKNAWQDSINDEWGFLNRECTSFVAWRLNNRNGVNFNNSYGGVHWGYASNWGNAARSAGIAVDMNPAVGAVYWEAGGHVAWVEAVNGNNVTIEEYNWGDTPGLYHEQTIDKNRASGYIHIKDISVKGHVMTENEAAGQTIPDGDYWICSALNPIFYLDIAGDKTLTTGNVNVQSWIWEKTMPPISDIWTLEYLNNGFYKIKQKNSNICMSVEYASMTQGANLIMWEWTGTDEQQWSIEKSDKGYKIRSKRNAFVINLTGSEVKNSVNACLFTDKSENNQLFGFIPYSSDENKIIEDGVYNISTACDSSYYLDIAGLTGEYKDGSNVQLWESATDKFVIKYAGDGWYKIHEESTGLSLKISDSDLSNGYLNNGCNAIMYKDIMSRSQLWKFEKTSDGNYFIISKLNGYYLDLNSGKCVNSQNISMFIYNGGSKNQKWSFEKVGNIESTLSGDINEDESINSADIVMLQQYLTKKDTMTNSANADMNGDGKIDVFDGILLRRLVLKNKSESLQENT